MTESNSDHEQHPAATFPWDEDAIFRAVRDANRRRLLARVADGGTQTGSQLRTAMRRNFDTVLQQLAVLSKAGLVLKIRNQSDGRAWLYALNPAIIVTKTEDRVILAFSFGSFRLPRR